MPLHPEPEYLAHLAAGKFMLQRARASGKMIFYPRVPSQARETPTSNGLKPAAPAWSIPPP